MEVQSIIIDKNKFSKKKANAFVKKNFKLKKVDEKTHTYRYRQTDVDRFNRKSLRTIKITEGVKAVVGKLMIL